MVYQIRLRAAGDEAGVDQLTHGRQYRLGPRFKQPVEYFFGSCAYYCLLSYKLLIRLQWKQLWVDAAL